MPTFPTHTLYKCIMALARKTSPPTAHKSPLQKDDVSTCLLMILCNVKNVPVFAERTIPRVTHGKKRCMLLHTKLFDSRLPIPPMFEQTTALLSSSFTRYRARGRESRNRRDSTGDENQIMSGKKVHITRSHVSPLRPPRNRCKSRSSKNVNKHTRLDLSS